MESIIALVDRIIATALHKGASDIHLQPEANAMHVRFRIDGLLQTYQLFENADKIIARIKILAHLNSAEKRIPQDGRFSWSYDTTHLDIRVATFPCASSEKIVLRILQQEARFLELEQLGMSSTMLESFKRIALKPYGFFLVTGPTGSGKTTTLYSMLQVRNAKHNNIVTLEDPVEYTIKGITQGNIHPEIGFSFAKGLKALLRQDPDIIMVGEIRDQETASIALQAALTGHLVLSTLHTSDTTSALVRLIDMGIEPFLLNAALNGVLAQRLARKKCEYCMSTQECKYCNATSFKGRIGVFELFEPSESFKEQLQQKKPYYMLRKQAEADGLISLYQDGISKVEQNILEHNELHRVLL